MAVAGFLVAVASVSAESAATVTLTGLSQGATVSGSVTLGASTSSNAVQVKWYVDGREVGWDGSWPWSASWSSTTVADGSHTAYARAATNSGVWSTSASVTFTVQNAPPPPPPPPAGTSSVVVTAPTAGSTVSSRTTLSASASDPTGITQVKWYVDGAEVGWDGAASWSVTWDSTTVASGSHRILAKAQTGGGSWLTSPDVYFTVSNTGATVSPKWRLVLSDNFDGTAVDSTKWRIFGPNWRGNAGNGLRDGRAVSVQNGVLTITAQMINGVLVSGGLRSVLEQTYGRFEFRARADPDPSLAMSGVVLTWPASGNFPAEGENDIWETLHNATRNPFYSFIHYSSSNLQYYFVHNGDASQWHDMAMEWEPNAIRIYRDGVLDGTVTDTYAIPDWKHYLALQFDAFRPYVSGAPRMQIDYARIYERMY
jgi:hypothetical protein